MVFNICVNLSEPLIYDYKDYIWGTTADVICLSACHIMLFFIR